MKKSLLNWLLLLSGLFTGIAGHPQTALAPDQNPDFAVSRNKYMKIADSLSAWHSTTLQENYKAIDWLEDRRQARADRREFRRQLRMERARGRFDYYDDYDYYYPYRGYRRYGYPNNYRYRGNRFFISPWGLGYRWR